MSHAIDFDQVLEQAFQASKANLSAVEDVLSLQEQLNASVLRVTDGAVAVQLYAKQNAIQGRDELIETIETWKQGERYANELAARIEVAAVKLPAQDPVQRTTLWEVEFTDTGYPVTLFGPELDSSVTCVTPEDLAEAFVEAARHGVVGRKLEMLRQLTGSGDNDGA